MGSQSSENFAFDSRRERVLADFLNTVFYPEVAESWTYTTEKSRQEAGEDLTATFDWLEEAKIVDEKAQSSPKWLNSPADSFAMEIYSDSWWEGGKPQHSIGWFVNPEIETEYYVLVWLPDVSLFKRDGPFLHYRPGTVLETMFSRTSESTDFEKVGEDPPEYRINTETVGEAAFDQLPETAPDEMRDGSGASGNWEYAKQNIYEAKVAVVEKQAIVDTLAADGFSRDVLLEKGIKAIEKSGTVTVDSRNIRTIMRSGDKNSGSSLGENPVIAVVPYQTYHRLADRTFHYKHGSWEEGVELF